MDALEEEFPPSNSPQPSQQSRWEPPKSDKVNINEGKSKKCVKSNDTHLLCFFQLCLILASVRDNVDSEAGVEVSTPLTSSSDELGQNWLLLSTADVELDVLE